MEPLVREHRRLFFFRRRSALALPRVSHRDYFYIFSHRIHRIHRMACAIYSLYRIGLRHVAFTQKPSVSSVNSVGEFGLKAQLYMRVCQKQTSFLINGLKAQLRIAQGRVAEQRHPGN